MLRIFHVPSHLTYVAKLSSPEFTPVPSPSGLPLRVADLVALDSWDFFDVLHVHTVELATACELEQLALRAGREDKALVFTVHDLAPNIEADRAAFELKTTLLARRASAAVTLSATAAAWLEHHSGLAPSTVRVVPHGAALPLELIGAHAGGTHIAAFGALRPNRDFVGLVRAWRTLTPPRPPLRLLVRSLSEHDQQRYARSLAELDQTAQAEPDLDLTTTPEIMPPEQLASWCQHAALLVLPYSTITHSGQLELARDLGIRALVPDVTTLRDQVAGNPQCSRAWFPPQVLHAPHQFADYLRAGLSLPSPAEDGDAVRKFRATEHQQIIQAHSNLYATSAQDKV